MHKTSIGSWAYNVANDNVGRIYYYERTNIDGTNAERVTVFRRGATEIEVYKDLHWGSCYS